MEPYFVTIMVVLVTVVATIVIAPILLFRPLVMAISNRIAPKNDNEEVKLLKARVATLERELNDIHSRMGAIEDSSQFNHKVLEDVLKKNAAEANRPGTESVTK